MWLNVYVSYAVLTLCAAGAYGLFSKRINRKGLTDGVGFEPTVRYERTHTFQARLANGLNEHRRSITAVTETLLRSLRSETRPKTALSRIQTVYSAPAWTRETLAGFRFSEQGSRDLERAIRSELRNRPPFAFEVQEWQ
jgi:hypothetical protein